MSPITYCTESRLLSLMWVPLWAGPCPHLLTSTVLANQSNNLKLLEHIMFFFCLCISHLVASTLTVFPFLSSWQTPALLKTQFRCWYFLDAFCDLSNEAYVLLLPVVMLETRSHLLFIWLSLVRPLNHRNSIVFRFIFSCTYYSVWHARHFKKRMCGSVYVCVCI